MPRVLVVSEASINRPHRRAYDLLARQPGWEVHIVAPRRLPTGSSYKLCEPAPADAGYQLHQLMMALPRVPRFQWFVGLAAVAARIRPDVAFVEWDAGSWPVLQAWLATRPFRCPVVTYTVENIRRNRWTNARVAAARGAVASAAKEATAGVLDALGLRVMSGLASVNEDGIAIYRNDRGWRGPVEFVPLGTDLTLFRPMDMTDLRRELGLEGSFVVGYFGRLIPEKSVHRLVEALPGLGGDVKLLLDVFTNFAPGSYAAELLTSAQRLGVRQRVVTVDVGHEDVPRYMNCCDAVVLPTVTTDRVKEQFGRVLTEAMACEIPVVGSTCGSIPFLIGDAGWVFPEGDFEAMVDTIRALRRNVADREVRRKAGRERVRRLFSVEAQRDALMRIFAQVGCPGC